MTAAVYSFPVPPIKRLRAAGVNVACGHDGICDLWGPYGSGDMLERAMHVAYRSTFRRDEDIELALEAATYGGARALGLERTGWRRARRPTWSSCGAHAAEAVVTRPVRELVLKDGAWSPATGRSPEPAQRATSSTTFPRLSAAMLRSKALAASSSANTESMAGGRRSRRRAAPRSAQAAGSWAPPRCTRW